MKLPKTPSILLFSISIAYFVLATSPMEIAYPQSASAPGNSDLLAKTERFAKEVIEANNSVQSIQLSFEITSFGRDHKGVVRNLQIGTIAFQRPYKLAVRYKQGAAAGAESQVTFEDKLHFVTDGAAAWMPYKSSRFEETLLVGKFDIRPWQATRETRFKTRPIPDQNEQNGQRDLSTPISSHQLHEQIGQQTKSLDAATKEYISVNHSVFLDAIEPLLGVPLYRAKYERDEQVNGTACRVFWTERQPDEQDTLPITDLHKALEQQFLQIRPQRHWIGIADGVPRRIDYFCGVEVCTTTTVSKVLVNQTITPEAFSAPKSRSPAKLVENLRKELEDEVKARSRSGK